MNDPYKPPDLTDTPPVTTRRRSFFYGGYITVAVVGILFGAGVGALIITDIAQPVLIWGAPVLGWFLALAVLVCIMRSSRFTAVGDLLLALALVPPAYILYVPVCTVSAMFTKSWIPSNDYGPAPNGVIIGSTVAFLVILLSIALILRFSFGLRQLPSESTTQSTHAPPDSEPS